MKTATDSRFLQWDEDTWGSGSTITDAFDGSERAPRSTVGFYEPERASVGLRDVAVLLKDTPQENVFSGARPLLTGVQDAVVDRLYWVVSRKSLSAFSTLSRYVRALAASSEIRSHSAGVLMTGEVSHALRSHFRSEHAFTERRPSALQPEVLLEEVIQFDTADLPRVQLHLR